MSEIKVNSIKDAAGNGNISVPNETGSLVTTAAGSVESAMTTQFGRRNLIINGAMQVAQRGTSASVTSGAAFTTDRFQMYNQSSGAYTLEQSSDAPAGFDKSTKITTTTAGSTGTSGWTCFLQTKLEGYDVAHLNAGSSDAQTVTLSFWVKSSVTGDMTLKISNNNDREYLTSYTVNTANTWEYKTVTFTLATDGTWLTNNGRGLHFAWGLGSGSTYTTSSVDSWLTGADNYYISGDAAVGATLNATWQITGVQLEVGSVATPFEHRSYGEELALCQRYYQKSYREGTYAGAATLNGSVGGYYISTSGNSFCHCPFVTSMRAVPSVTVYDIAGTSGKITGGSYAALTATTYQLSEHGFNVEGLSNPGADSYVQYVAEAEL